MPADVLERGAALIIAASPGVPLAGLLLILGHRTLPRTVIPLGVAMGAFAALSTFGGLILTPLIGQVADPILRAFLRAFAGASAPEEAAKLYVLVAMVLRHEDAVDRRDAVLAGAWVGLGFALLENLLYVSASPQWAALGFFRAATAVPSHVALGLIMGWLLSGGRPYAAVLGVPLLLHGLYDWAIFSIHEHTRATDAQLLAWGALYFAVLAAEWLMIRGPVCRAIAVAPDLPPARGNPAWIGRPWFSAALMVLLLLSAALVMVVGVRLASSDARLVALASGAVMPLAFLDLLVRSRRLARGPG